MKKTTLNEARISYDKVHSSIASSAPKKPLTEPLPVKHELAPGLGNNKFSLPKPVQNNSPLNRLREIYQFSNQANKLL